ncbi:hypothetical protein [Cytobacillus purgationiresistens]|uniref:Transcriptional regulator with XRE-family HTH domain n=1 Tax=Cytobacillus purgationiresistens TaxID=863449 RepID=A0ABU0AVC2_9BACI|nr:hypothetical protein [Cytobacillus purgationiresistens]MDQ0273935.1 transcriptional regulator with XRE-family HTH domain [Cytobacillus purgationiresistens]
MLPEYNIGEILYSLRQNKSITIEELTKGICTKEEYERFEKESAYPTVEQLYLLGQRLQVNLVYFFSMAKKCNQNYSQLVINLINKYKRVRDYQTIYDIVLKEQHSPIFDNVQLKQFLKWHEGVCLYYLHNETEKALELLDDAIKLTNKEFKNLTESEIEILTSIAMIAYESKDYVQARNYFEQSLDELQRLPSLVDPKVKIRILFGFSQSLTEEGEYERSLTYCQQGINLCIEVELLYLLAELHYQSGENFIKLGEVKTGKHYIEKSLFLCDLTKHEKMGVLMKAELTKMISSLPS